MMDLTLRYEERAVFALRSLYSGYGYSHYKMQKFEEYDLYVRNKDFLIGDSVITFTDTNGKLMALKPDVTLSIIKNSKDVGGYVEKLYYNENVYRVSGGSKSFREIMQVGLECLGDIDDYGISEVLTLAGKSLALLSEDFLLSLSHLGMLSAVLDEAPLSPEARHAILTCIEEKNLHELHALCEQSGVPAATAEAIATLIATYGRADEVLPRLAGLCQSAEYTAAYEQLAAVLALVTDRAVRDRIQIDFSVVSDTKYYNGLVFKGFLEKVPSSVLSGGQYDALMQRMGKRARAIGFAVYLDQLDPLKGEEPAFEQDILLLYDETTDRAALRALTEELIAKGNRVSAQRAVPEKLTYRQLIKLKGKEVEILEENA